MNIEKINESILELIGILETMEPRYERKRIIQELLLVQEYVHYHREELRLETLKEDKTGG